MNSKNQEIAVTEDISISVVIPCYNSDYSLTRLIHRIRDIFVDSIDEPYEIILVDDGSPSPGTWQTISALARQNPEVRAFQLTRNFGKPGALMCGYSQSKGKWVIVMDDDLQHIPEDIPLLLDQRHHSLVMGNFPVREHVLWQKLTSKLKGWLDYKLIGKPRNVYLSPFHLIHRDIIDAVLRINSPSPHIGALMMHVTRDVVMVNVTHQSREHGKSNFTFIRRVKQFSNLLINNSSLLLKLVAWFGMGLSLLSVLYGTYLTLRWFMIEEIAAGWTSIMVVMLMIGGVLMLSLGIVGEYLLRIINGLENRPSFLIGKRTDEPKSPDQQ
jgi:glycosyltransferase involved in cell wall biosynthesis